MIGQDVMPQAGIRWSINCRGLTLVAIWHRCCEGYVSKSAMLSRTATIVVDGCSMGSSG